MTTYTIEQYELHTQKYEVEANSEAEAISKLYEGEGLSVDDGLEFIEVADDYGLPVDGHRELADELSALGFMFEKLICSIRNIESE